MTVDIETGRKLLAAASPRPFRMDETELFAANGMVALEMDMDGSDDLAAAEWLFNNADALLAELEALRAVREAITPLEPSLRSAERSNAPAFLMGLCMEAPDIKRLLAALARHKEVTK